MSISISKFISTSALALRVFVVTRENIGVENIACGSFFKARDGVFYRFVNFRRKLLQSEKPLRQIMTK